MSEPPQQLLRSLDQQRAEYASRRGLAMPLAGLIVWTLIGVAGVFLSRSWLCGHCSSVLVVSHILA